MARIHEAVADERTEGHDRPRVEGQGAGLDGLAEFSVVEPGEADAADKRVSAASPLGRALLGHQVGDEVHFRAPAGVLAVTVLEVNC